VYAPVFGLCSGMFHVEHPAESADFAESAATTESLAVVRRPPQSTPTSTICLMGDALEPFRDLV
jgi:hypothetical protein